MSAVESLTTEEIATVEALVAEQAKMCSCRVDDDACIEPCPRCEAEELLPGWSARLLATIRVRDEEIVEAAKEMRERAASTIETEDGRDWPDRALAAAAIRALLPL